MTQAQVYSFPTRYDRALVHAYVTAYAQGAISRTKMMTAVAMKLDEYGITRLKMGSYVVVRTRDEVTPVRKVLGVSIEPRYISGDEKCPECGEGPGEYIAGEAPAVTFWCRNCHRVYEAQMPPEGVKP